MALRTPVGVACTTSTAGTGTYTLQDNTSEDGRQNVQDAYALGILSDGDQVYYNVLDDTTSGPDFDYEYGTGVLGDSGATLTRDTIIESSNGGLGGSKVAWSPGGTRTVLVVTGDWALVANNGSEYTAATFATNLGLPRLAAANTFTAAQTVRSPTSPQLLVDEGSGGGQTQLRIKNTNLSQEWAIRIVTDTNLRIRDITGGTDVLQLSTAGALLNSSGNKYDAFPSGQELTSHTVPPAGWTRVNETQSRVIRMAKSGDTIGATGGSDDIFDGSWQTAGHTLTEAQIPSHTHTIFNFESSVDDTSPSVLKSRTQDSTGGDDRTSGATGGGGSHSHNMATPYYRISCIMRKD